MMILVDTNLFIDFWKAPTEEITRVFKDEDIALCGVVRAELLHGAVSEKNISKITTMLEAFDELDFDREDWQKLGEMLYKLRIHGVSVPFTDAIIAATAIKYSVPVWTNDGHFKLVQTVLEELKIYEP